ncbi:MAG: ferritin family protein [Thermoplasmata archaeon]|nr:ferritin family protein [Thermoplasmata archaeon]
MELENFELKILLLAAIKSEIESKEVYETLASRVKNALFKDRLLFLANEEEKHRAFLESLYRQKFAGEEIKLPEKSPVPLPVVDTSEDRLLSEIIEDAMKAELAAKEFYEGMKKMFSDERTKNMLQLLADMERGHYEILLQELENLKRFEDYDDYWPMMHVGP